MRDFCIDNAVSWLRDWHLDGLRLDAVHAIVDDSPTHVLAEMRRHVDREVSPDRWLIAESDRLDPRLVAWGMSAQWSDDVHHALHSLLTGERDGYYAAFGDTSHLVRALSAGYVREPRAPLTALPDARRLVAFTQNHDQVGNRAAGDRLCHLVSPGRARMAAAWVLLSPFIPMLFMGEEWAASTPFPFFSDHQDPEIARATTEGRRQEFAAFGWRPEDIPDPQAESTFVSARLRWAERTAGDHGEMLGFYRSLLAVRRERLGGASAPSDVRTLQGDGWLRCPTVASRWRPTGGLGRPTSPAAATSCSCTEMLAPDPAAPFGSVLTPWPSSPPDPPPPLADMHRADRRGPRTPDLYRPVRTFVLLPAPGGRRMIKTFRPDGLREGGRRRPHRLEDGVKVRQISLTTRCPDGPHGAASRRQI